MQRIVVVALVLLLAIPVSADVTPIPATANIFGSSHATAPNPGGGGAGFLPPSISFSAGPGKVFTLSQVSGMATLTNAHGLNGPDGTTVAPAPTDISSFGGISGIKADRHGFLVGVFVGPSEAADPSPAVLDFGNAGVGIGFTTLSPDIGQTFFIGDGLTGTGTGATQEFNIPSTATRLYVGFADGSGYVGMPGQYQDNSGSFTAYLCISRSLTVPATANIFGSSHATAPNPGGGGAGFLPPSISFSAGPGKVFTLSQVSGMATLTNAHGLNGPDGTTVAPAPTDISSFGGISGIKADRHGFLVGVFVGPSEAADPSPAVLDFGNAGVGIGFTTLSPDIGQTFFIGDGLTGTGTGATQEFNIPSTATRLYVGFADGGSYVGMPGQYQDNSGSITAQFAVCCASIHVVPATAVDLFTLSSLLFGLGVIALYQIQRRQV